MACAITAWMIVTCVAGCGMPKERKIRDLEAVIVSEEALPKELKEIIDSKKEKPFRFTYSDQKNLYVCIGYGMQETGGYSVVLDELYLTETSVRVSTTLLGPDAAGKAIKKAACPYLVIRTEAVEQPVVFQ